MAEQLPDPQPQRPAETKALTAGGSDGGLKEQDLRPFYDVPIEVSVQLDRKRVKLRQVLELRVDSVLPMGRSAGENVDLLLDGALVGNGEIVVIDNMVGLRITDLRSGRKRRGLTPSETRAEEDGR
jgi:flagellar motor switch protein FliN/FliY